MRKNRMKKILVMCVIINILFCAEVESVLKGTTGNELVLGSCIANDRSTLLWFINTATNSNKCVGGRI